MKLTSPRNSSLTKLRDCAGAKLELHSGGDAGILRKPSVWVCKRGKPGKEVAFFNATSKRISPKERNTHRVQENLREMAPKHPKSAPPPHTCAFFFFWGGGLGGVCIQEGAIFETTFRHFRGFAERRGAKERIRALLPPGFWGQTGRAGLLRASGKKPWLRTNAIHVQRRRGEGVGAFVPGYRVGAMTRSGVFPVVP